MSSEAPHAMFTAYKRVNALINAQDMVVGGPIIAALAVQMGQFDSLSQAQQTRLANAMTGQHVMRDIPQVGDTPFGERMNTEIFGGRASVVPMHRMQDLWQAAHRDAAHIITQGRALLEAMRPETAQEDLAFYLQRQAHFLLEDPFAVEAETAYIDSISTEFGRRHMSDGFRLTRAARLKALLRAGLVHTLGKDNLVVTQFGKDTERIVGAMTNLALPWGKKDTTLTGLEAC